MTAPLVPPEVDLRDFPYMPMEVVRLRDSDSAALMNGEAFRSAVMLWCHAWHQVPASSLPNDDRVLARHAGFGRDIEAWQAVRDDALHGFILCDDGRLYHSTIAEKALESWSVKTKRRRQTAAATEARQRNDQRNDQRNVDQVKLREENGETTRDSARDARELSGDASLEEALREAGGEALNSASPGLLDLSPILRLIAAGCLLHEDVLPTMRVRSAGKRPGSIRNYGYYVPAIIEARDRRLIPVPEPPVIGKGGGPPRRRKSERMEACDQLIEELRANEAAGKTEPLRLAYKRD